jgi:ABC-type transport system involved in multi-copper enzyme maturation permease subunit
MTFLPIVARELRLAARRRSTYWMRAGAALWIVLIGTWFFLMMQQQPPAEVSLILFSLLTGSAVLYCLLSGVRSTADCLSEEKREGTLGLLFLTDLKGYDVVMGKLAATSLGAFYCVLAIVPMLAIPLLMGGVAVGEFERMALVAVNAMFFSLTLGLCISALSRSARKAMTATFLLIVLFNGLLPACGAWLAFRGLPQPGTLFLLPSSGFAFYLAFDASYKAGADNFWHSLLVIHLLGWMFLVAASVIAPRSWQDKPAGAQRLRWRERWQNWSYGTLAERSAFRRSLLNTNAFFWLAARARLKPAYVWSVLALLGCGWAWGLAKYHRDWLGDATYFVTGVLLNVLLKAWVAAEAGRQLAEDRQHGTLELLLSTPLTVRDILRGQWLALKRQFLGPFLFVLAVFLIFIFASSFDTVTEEHGLWTLLWLGGMLMLVADSIALYWVGMWQGLTARSPNRAATASLARILLFPWAGIAVALLLVAIASMAGQYEPTSGKFFLGLWLALGLAADFGFGAWASFKLRTEFRQAAAQKYDPHRGFWKRFLSGS